jgi:uncharacterized protein YndB with AHSA1/START domain
MEDRIEQQITINASLERVWEMVSEPGWWVPAKVVAPVDHTPGHQVVRVEPKTYAAFRWASQFPGQELRDGNTTLVEFSVEPIGTAVRVTVTESGFTKLEAPDSVREDAWKSNTSGWQQELSGLKDRSEAPRSTRAE